MLTAADACVEAETSWPQACDCIAARALCRRVIYLPAAWRERLRCPAGSPASVFGRSCGRILGSAAPLPIFSKARRSPGFIGAGAVCGATVLCDAAVILGSLGKHIGRAPGLHLGTARDPVLHAGLARPSGDAEPATAQPP
jgi:hypothetical protein